MDFLKINLRCILLQIQGKIAEQTAAETTVEIVFEHMVQHIKYIFRGRKNRVGLTVKFHERRLQMIRGEDLIYQLVGTGKLIDANDTVMEFQGKGTAGFRKGKAVGNMMITVFRLLCVSIRLENTTGTGKSLFFENIKIQISQFSVFGNRIIGGEAHTL